MRRSPNSSRDQCHRHVVLLCAAHVLSCAPSDFDKFTTGTSEEPSTCETRRCKDGGASELDAALDADAEGSEDAAEPSDGALPPDSDDGAVDAPPLTPIDATAQDADDAPLDGASNQAQDAAPDAPDPRPDIGPCDGSMPVCQANRIEPGMEPCGLCKSGKRQRSRTCAADGCSWSAWSAWSACEGEKVECDPSAPAPTQSVPCTTCGARTQSRSCSAATCTWEAWKDVSACSWCDACSEVVYCDTPSNIADRGTWCRQKACSQPQALANCMEDAKSVCGGITQPFFMEYL